MQIMQRPPGPNNKKVKGKGKGNSDLAKLLSTRGGLVAVAAIAALIAAALLTVFLQHYKKSLTSEGTRTVLVAKTVIPKGSSGDVVADESMFQTSKAQGNQVKAGALTDPHQLAGKVSADTIYPGQQPTAADFAAGGTAVNTKIAGDQRAITVPMDSSHGMIGDVHAGDHVDIYASFNAQSDTGRVASVVSLLMRNAMVLRVDTSKSGTGSTHNVVLQTPDPVTPKVAFTVDNGKVWIVERPQAGAKDTNLSPITVQNVLAGVRPVSGSGR